MPFDKIWDFIEKIASSDCSELIAYGALESLTIPMTGKKTENKILGRIYWIKQDKKEIIKKILKHLNMLESDS